MTEPLPGSRRPIPAVHSSSRGSGRQPWPRSTSARLYQVAFSCRDFVSECDFLLELARRHGRPVERFPGLAGTYGAPDPRVALDDPEAWSLVAVLRRRQEAA